MAMIGVLVHEHVHEMTEMCLVSVAVVSCVFQSVSQSRDTLTDTLRVSHTHRHASSS